MIIDCDQCDDFYYGECPTHNFNIIEDNDMEAGKTTPGAIKSLPENLCVKSSTIPEAGMGVFAKEKLEVNTRFGPYRGDKILKEDLEEGRNTSYMWEVWEKQHYMPLNVQEENFINYYSKEYLTNIISKKVLIYNQIYRLYKKGRFNITSMVKTLPRATGCALSIVHDARTSKT